MLSPLIKNIDLFLDNKPSVYALREKAKQTLLSTGFPTLKTEAWKYTPVTVLTNKNFNIDTSDKICGDTCCSHQHQQDDAIIEIKFCKGKLHIEEYNTPTGLTITPLPLALYENEYKKYIFNSFELEKHPFAALNGMYLEQGICIYIDKNTKIEKPLVIKYNQSSADSLQLNIHNIIILEQNAKADLIEQFSSHNSNSYFTNIVNEIYLKTNASLTHYTTQNESPNAYHIVLNAVKQQKGSNYKHFYFASGAKLSRHETLINLEQENARAEIYTAYTTKKDTLTDITTNINHLSKETFSNQYAKAVLNADSTAVFQGKIHIAPQAVKTSGHQLHKALYLNDNATLNCKPELEIYADDVKCSHGASCGELNKDQLFYLTSRGINQQTAKEILTNAHLEEIKALITDEKIKDLLFFSK